MKEKGGLRVSAKVFVGTLCILLACLVFAGVLTQTVPMGAFDRVTESGREVIVPGTYRETPEAARLPVWKIILAPVLVLGGSSSATAIMIILLILLIGGTFLVLEKSGVLDYIMAAIIKKYGAKKYTLLRVMILCCMLMGSVLGMFEETITLAPITVALAVALGWDTLVGVGMSVLAVGFGFASGTLNPFTVGVPQKLAELPLFSGLWLRVLVFACVYLLVSTFLVAYAKKVEKDPASSLMAGLPGVVAPAPADYEAALARPELRKAAIAFGVILSTVLVYIVAGFFIPALADYSMPYMAVAFTAGGIVAGRIARLKKLGGSFLAGIGSIAPSALLILLALGVTYVISAGGILDTLLSSAYNAISGLSPYAAVLAVLGVVLVLQFFIGSAVSKAFMVMPVIVPLADLLGLTRQTVVQAFIFGDGFTNLIFPTNAALLITIGLVGIPYGRWFKWTWKLQLALLALSVVFLEFSVFVHYGPF